MSYSFEHLKTLLWTRPEVHVYAFVRGEIMPELRQHLAKAKVNDWDCLLRGAVSAQAQASAPYVVDLEKDSAWTDWLLTEAGDIYPNWGLIGCGDLSFLDARELGRTLMQVKLPGGETVSWNWTDPQLWFGLLPQLDMHQLHAAFGGMSHWLHITVQQWRWHTLSAGQLSVIARDGLA